MHRPTAQHLLTMTPQNKLETLGGGAGRQVGAGMETALSERGNKIQREVLVGVSGSRRAEDFWVGAACSDVRSLRVSRAFPPLPGPLP